jgi:hypothetical protein
MHPHFAKSNLSHYPPEEKGVYPVPAEDKNVTRPEHEEALDKSSPAAAAEEMYIPDYVMLDFGFPEGMRPSGRTSADRVS